MVNRPIITRDSFFPAGAFGFTHRGRDLFPFQSEDLYFYAYGRFALFQGLSSLGLLPGDRVLAPDYVCNSVMAPFNALGLDVDLYSVDDRLRPDWAHVRHLLSPLTKALVIVNYFGFPNDLIAARHFCDEYGLAFIEDNAHGFLSEHKSLPLGSFGDIAFFSFHKTLPVPNGAALVVNRPVKTICSPERFTCQMDPAGSVRFLLRQAYRCVTRRLPRDHAAKAACYVREIDGTYDKNEENDIGPYSGTMTALSRFILGHFDPRKVIDHRRTAYNRWNDFVRGHFACDDARPLFPGLPPGACPLVFPLYAGKRDEFLAQMRFNGVEAYPWPFLPSKSNECHFSKHVVCLPLTGALHDHA